MKRKLIGAFLIFLLGIISAATENKYGWHSTAFQFQEMMKKDLDMLRQLKNDLDHERNILSNLKQKATYELENNIPMLDDDSSGEKFNEQLHEDVQDFKNKEIFSDLKEKLNIFPNFTDRYAVLENLFLVQRLYKLKTKDLAQGNINGFPVKYNMTANDCADMGDIATGKKVIDLCLEWYNETLERILAGSPCKHSEKLVRDGIKHEEDLLKCKKLCRDGKPILPIDINQYKCYLWDNFRDPWLILQPYKMEVLTDNPNIARFYDVVSDYEIEELKSFCMDHFASAKTVLDKTQVTKIGSSRIAHNCWLSDGGDTLKKISDRIGHLTGLDMSPSEMLQVATYGIGGHYVPHFDWHKKNETEEYTFSNRIGTFMLYLSDVEQGGSTIFLHPGLAVPPVKGSALFWHNLDKSGSLDNRTKHSACHVLVGNKWVANKWIRETKKEMCKKTEYIGRIV
ncbi:prolyl 4-hydroxylase subunit alpha-2-like [Styela clava]